MTGHEEPRVATPESPRASDVAETSTEVEERDIGRMIVDTRYRAADTLCALNGDSVDLRHVADELGAIAADVNSGDFRRPEAMLAIQANVLDGLFQSLATRATMSKDLNLADGFLRVALRAQRQCLATIGAIHAMRNPQRVTFVGQTNVAHGPQQVSIGLPVAAPPEIRPIEQLERQRGSEWLDTRAAGAASDGDPSVEAVGAVDRATNTSRQGKGR